MEGAVGGVTSAAHNTLCNVPPRGHPVGQPIVFGDLSSDTVTGNLALCPTCLACLLQLTLGQCQLGHLALLQRLQRTLEVLLRPGLTRVGQTPLFETNVWLTVNPD